MVSLTPHVQISVFLPLLFLQSEQGLLAGLCVLLCFRLQFEERFLYLHFSLSIHYLSLLRLFGQDSLLKDLSLLFKEGNFLKDVGELLFQLLLFFLDATRLHGQFFLEKSDFVSEEGSHALLQLTEDVTDLALHLLVSAFD